MWNSYAATAIQNIIKIMEMELLQRLRRKQETALFRAGQCRSSHQPLCCQQESQRTHGPCLQPSVPGSNHGIALLHRIRAVGQAGGVECGGRRRGKISGMIMRIWHGWTRRGDDAETYDRMLRDEILPGIHRIDGYRGSFEGARL